MLYRLVLHIPFEVALVSREAFEDKAHAEQHLNEKYSDFPAMEVLTDVEIGLRGVRVVPFPEKTTS